MDNKKTVFITGATGLVGSYLLKILLQNGYKVYALAKSKDDKNAKDRVIDILKFWDKDIFPRKSYNLSVLEGDITQNNFGLNKQNLDLLKNEIEEIFHCAAITQFNWPLKEIRKVNVGGTKNMLELAVKCNERGRLKKATHISTAYVCGDYKGIFKEDDLDLGQGFITPYEQSKFEAEKLVKEYRQKELWIDIFRPPIIVGESRTGKVLSFDRAFYQALHLWNSEIFIYYPIKDNCSLNVVFIDELCKSIFCISSKDLQQNKTYHPFSTQTLSPEAIIDITSEFLRVVKPKLIPFEDYIRNKTTPSQMLLLKHNLFFLDRNAILDSTETKQLLKKYGLNFSTLNKELFLKLLKYCVKKGFLHKKRSFKVKERRP